MLSAGNGSYFCTKEISRLLGAVDAGGKTLVPLRVYFKNALIKVEIALCVGKRCLINAKQ